MAIDPQRVVIGGVGGLGSWLAHAIGRTLEYHAPGSMLVLVDGDTFEPKNIERQSFTALGNKAQVVRQDIMDSLPNTYVIAKPAWIVAEDQIGYRDPEESEGVGKITAAELMQENDWVFAVFDNFSARKLILEEARNYDNIDVFVAGNDDGLFGSIYHYRRRDGQDVTHHPSVFHDEFVNPPDKNPGELSCAERAKIDGGSQLLAINLEVAAQLMAKVSLTMLGKPEQEAKAMANAEIYFEVDNVAYLGHDRLTEVGVALYGQAQHETAPQGEVLTV